MGTLPKSDSNTSLSSLISIGNESKISEIAVNDKCIICLGEDSLKSSIVNKVCTCSYYYHEKCLETWHTKHSSLCPLCRQQSAYPKIYAVPVLVTWPKSFYICLGIVLIGFAVWLVVKLVINK